MSATTSGFQIFKYERLPVHTPRYRQGVHVGETVSHPTVWMVESATVKHGFRTKRQAVAWKAAVDEAAELLARDDITDDQYSRATALMRRYGIRAADLNAAQGLAAVGGAQ